MSSEASLAFLLQGPFQSWGTSSRYQRRTTDPFPSKSGVLGLVAAALGIDKHAVDETERLKPLAALRLEVYRVPLHHADRVLPVLRLEDYHTLGGGYDEDYDPWARANIPRKASGGPFGTVVTRRDYLTDAAFLVVLTGDPSLLGRIAVRLEDPVWGVWLGRKCCVPSVPLQARLERNPEAAVAAVMQQAAGMAPTLGVGEPWRYGIPERVSCEVGDGDSVTPLDGADTCADQPESYGHRRHVTRTFRRGASAAARKEDQSSTSP